MFIFYQGGINFSRDAQGSYASSVLENLQEIFRIAIGLDCKTKF